MRAAGYSARVTEEQRVVAGRYAFIRELGRGGMGVVWLGEDRTIGRQVAIKELLLPPGIPPHEREVFEQRVLREARTAGRLSDPGIVTVHDVVQENGATYIVMELIEAENLADVIRAHGPMPAGQVLKIAEQVLIALQTAHAAGIVHRDVKPSNVMIAANGRVKLTDFGIAQSTEDSRLTMSGTLVGSPSYISPERLLGRDASPASDLWALGATLFFAAEGFGAYDRPTTAASIQAIVNERAQLRTVPPGPLAELIIGLLEPDPDDRITDGQAHYLIDQARRQPPPRPVHGTPSSPMTGNPQSGPQSLPPSGPQPVHQPPPAVPPTKVVPKSRKTPILAVVAAVILIGAVVVVLAVTGVFNAKKDNSAATPPASGGSNPPVTGQPGYTKTLTFGPGGDITSDGFTDFVGLGCFAGTSRADLKEADCKDPHVLELLKKIDLEGDTDAFPGAEAVAKTTEDGCVITDDHYETSIPGLFAAGDVVKGLDQISNAMGQAGVAATTIRNHLAREKPIRR